MKQCELDLKAWILSSEHVDFDDISSNYILSEEFIREFKDKLDWLLISEHQKLSMEFIEEFLENYLYLDHLFAYQKLSESFIEKHAHYKSDWEKISLNQNLSKEFIIKHFDKLHLNCLVKNKNFKFVVEDILLNINGEILSFKENNVNPSDFIA